MSPDAHTGLATVDLEPPWIDKQYGSVCYGPRGLPALTIGPQIIEWGMTWLTIPDGDLAGQPWIPVPEQARFICNLFALDVEAARQRRARWVYRRAALRRMKGAGKDPLAAFLCMAHLVGPVVPKWDEETKSWIGVPHAAPWIQVVAVSQAQTQTTSMLFNGMLPQETRDYYKLTVQETLIKSPKGRIAMLTSSPLSSEGPRPNFVVANEPQNWFASNGGHLMYAVLRRNLAKVGGRMAETGNSPENGRDSVSERTERAYNKWRAGKTTGDLRLLYDSREAPSEAKLDDPVLRRMGLRAARGDAFWVDFEDIETEMLDPELSPSDARRYYFNVSNAADDAWCDPRQWEACGTGYGIPRGRDVVVFADLSKSRDATAMIACDTETGHVQCLDVWFRPYGMAKKERWAVPRGEVLQRAIDAIDRWNVMAFWCDPGSGEDDEGKKYWDAVIDAISAALGRDVMPAVPAGPMKHRVRWDMRSPAHTQQFTLAAMRTATDIEDELITHDGHPMLLQHTYNAKKRANEYGVSMGKEHSDSSFHVDAGVAMVGARMMRLQFQEWVRTRRLRRPGVVSGVEVG